MELIVHPAIETEGKEDDELMELTRKVMSLLPSPDCLLCVVVEMMMMIRGRGMSCMGS